MSSATSRQKALLPAPYFGKLVVERGFASPEKVLETFDRCRESNREIRDGDDLGQNMVRLGFLTRRQFQEIRKSQLTAPGLSRDAFAIAAGIMAQLKGDNNIVVFTGLTEQSGVDRVCIELGMALLTMDVRDTVVVDTNFSRPTLHRASSRNSGQAAQVGLSELIQQRAKMDDAIIPATQNHPKIITAGNVAVDAEGLLVSEDCHTLFKQLRQDFGMVLIDAPPLLCSPATLAMARRADGVVLVVTAKKHTQRELNSAKQLCAQSQLPVLGLVFNQG